MPPADQARVQQAFDVYLAVQAGDANALAAMVTRRVSPEITDAKVAELRTVTQPGAPQSTKVLHWTATSGNGADSYSIIQRLDYAQQTVILNTVAVRQNGGPWLIDGLHFNSVSRAQADAASGFSLSNKSPAQYAMLVAMGLFPLICISAVAVAAWRRRWGWMIGSLFGFSQIALNWTTGEWGFQPIYISLLGAGAFKGAGPFDPWILSIAIPIPAILFWLLKRYGPKPAKVKAKPAVPPPPSDTPEL